MKIIEKRLDELQPYENNPRKNDRAVPYVAESIKRYGIKIPTQKTREIGGSCLLF